MTTARLPAGLEGPGFSEWSTARKWAAVGFALAGFSALATMACWLAGAGFLLANRVDPRLAGPFTIAQAWQTYAEDPLQRRRILVASGLAFGGLLVVLPVALIHATRPRRSLHGDARFANAVEIASAGLIAGATSRKGHRPSPAILVGRWRGQYLALPGQLSVMLSAPTRSGKGVGVVIPNLLNWPDSVVVLDIKGENHAITAGYRAECGQAVYAFSPFDDGACSHRWNPLAAVRTDARHRVGDLLAIGQVFFPAEGTGTSSEAFFNDQARNLFLGLGLLLLESPELPRTVGELLRQSSGKGESLKDHLSHTLQRRRDAGRPLSDECSDALQRLLANSENTLSSIVATFNAPLTIFADAIVDAATSACDFRLEDLRRRRMSVYVRIPPHRLASARPLLNLFFSQLVSMNTQVLPEHDASLVHQVLLVHDEFTAMGRVSVIAHAAAFLAGYNLRLLTVVQAMSQLDAVYGEKEARSFSTNHGLQILYAPREQRDADEYSAMLGTYTERSTSQGRSRSYGGQHGNHSTSTNESPQRRALLLPQEFKDLGAERLVLVVENCKPILADKIRYHREAVFQARLRPAPQVPTMDVELHLARVQLRWQELGDEVPDGQMLDVDRLSHELGLLPTTLDGSPDDIAVTLLRFFDGEASTPGEEALRSADTGGDIEALPDDDGVLVTEAGELDSIAGRESGHVAPAELSADLMPQH
jgi:type IV secretion system protein VirD4